VKSIAGWAGSILLENFFHGKHGGVFLDIGAYDGETLSTPLLRKDDGWTGLCVEPLPSAFAKLKATRKAICENLCVGDFEGEAEFVETDDLKRSQTSGCSAASPPASIRARCSGSRR